LQLYSGFFGVDLPTIGSEVLHNLFSGSFCHDSGLVTSL